MAMVGAALLLGSCSLIEDDPEAATPHGLDMTADTGGDGADGSAASDDPVAARWTYVAEANEQCELAIGRMVIDMEVPTDEAGMRALLTDAMARSQAMLDELRTVTPPPGDEAVVTAMLDLQDALIDRLQAVVAEPDLAAAVEESRADLEAMERAADAALVDYGLTSCADD